MTCTAIKVPGRHLKCIILQCICHGNTSYPAGIYLLKVSNRNTKTRCKVCSKLTITYFTPCSKVSIVNFEHVIATNRQFW